MKAIGITALRTMGALLYITLPISALGLIWLMCEGFLWSERHGVIAVPIGLMLIFLFALAYAMQKDWP